jgi:hypothetical protein
VEAEDLVLDEGGEGEVVEEVGEVLPHVGVAVLPQALVVEAVDLCDLAGFVVAAQDGDALGVADLEGDEEGDGLDGIVSSIDVVAYKRFMSLVVLDSLRCFCLLSPLSPVPLGWPSSFPLH